MRKLIVLVLALALLYGGYWVVGKSQIETRLADAIVDMDAGDMNVSYGALDTHGFPSRFDTTITDLVVEDPVSRVRWETPIFQLLALSYQPNNVRAYFPQEQVFDIDGERFTLFTEEMAARGQVSPTASLAFQQAELELLNPRLRTEEGAELALARFFAAMRLTPDTTQTYDVFFEARAIVLPEDIRTMVDPQNLQPPVIQSLRLDSDITLSAPIELNGGADVVPTFELLSVRELAIEWGEMSVSAIGDVTPDDTGVLNGSITVSARNWQQAMTLAVSTGAITDDNRFLIAGLASNLDETPHVPDTLTVTLTITDGEMAIGGFPLGTAPLLR
ncbi:MAG: DUF2125 domain-containing protein [Octadecabacter sp.]